MPRHKKPNNGKKIQVNNNNNALSFYMDPNNVVNFPDHKPCPAKRDLLTLKVLHVQLNDQSTKTIQNQSVDDYKVIAEWKNTANPTTIYEYLSEDNFIVLDFDRSTPSFVIRETLKSGFMVCFPNSSGKKRHKFVFLGYSKSQVQKRACVLYNQTTLGSWKELTDKFGDFDLIANPHKRALRISLLFSSAQRVLDLNDDQVQRIPDVELSGFNFTDGCGFMSVELAQEVAEKLGITRSYSNQEPEVPSVIQIRMQGCKGILIVEPKLTGRLVQIRPSMEKFKWRPQAPHALRITERGWSKPYQFGKLNKQVIQLLSGLGVAANVFLDKQTTYFQEMERLLTDKWVAIKHLCASDPDMVEQAEDYFLEETNKEIDDATQELLMIHYDDDGTQMSPNTESILKNIRSNVRKKDAKQKHTPAEGLKIPIEKSRLVYGVCDPYGKLENGQCFFQPTIRGKPTVLQDTKVAVSKCPCYSTGDIRILDCVLLPECCHLVDCLVFPIKGKRPHADEISGSDLDGDKFLVLWDSELVPLQCHPPASYQAAQEIRKENVTVEDMIEAFATFKWQLVGQIDTAFVKWSDANGINSPECRRLASLFARAVDSAKTGENVVVPSHLKRPPKALDPQYIWQKLNCRAKLYIQDKLDLGDNLAVKYLSKDDLKELVLSKQNLTEYQLFRLCYKWCRKRGCVDEELCDTFAPHLDFSHFTSTQKTLAFVDVPQLKPQYVDNVLYKSSILEKDHIETLSASTPTMQHGQWSMLYKEEGLCVTWDAVHRMLAMPQPCLFILNVLLRRTEKDIHAKDQKLVLTVGMYMPGQLRLNDTVTVQESSSYPSLVFFVDEYDHCLKLINMLESHHSEYMMELKEDYLQIYNTNYHNTFVKMMKRKGDKSIVISVALDRFPGISRDEKVPKINRDTCEYICAVEVFQQKSHPHFAPFVYVDKEQHNYYLAKMQHEAVPAEQDPKNDMIPPDLQNTRDFPQIRTHPGDVISKAVENQRQFDFLVQELNLVGQEGKLSKQELSSVLDFLHDIPEASLAIETLIGTYQDQICFEPSDEPMLFDLLTSLITNLTLCSSGDQDFDKIYRLAGVMERDQVSIPPEKVLSWLQFLRFAGTKHARNIMFLIWRGIIPTKKEAFLPGGFMKYWLHWTCLCTLEAREEVEQNRCKIIAPQVKVQLGQSESSPSSNVFLKSEIPGQPLTKGDLLQLEPVNLSKKTEPFVIIVEITDSLEQFVKPLWRSDGQQGVKLDDKIEYYAQFLGTNTCYQRRMDTLNTVCLKKSQKVVSPVVDDIVASFESQEVLPVNDTVLLECEPIKDLNKSQMKAVEKATTQNKVTLIHGPPGTGKTWTATHIICRWLKMDRKAKILACAETNEGVDNIVEKLLQCGAKEDEIIRLGLLQQVKPHLQCLTVDKRYESLYGSDPASRGSKRRSRKMAEILATAKVICATCIGARNPLARDLAFDYVLLDEAAQATEPSALCALVGGIKKLCLVGDHLQLPPFVLSDSSELKVSLFERLRQSGVPVQLLDTQYRMHPVIAEFPSRHFYEGLIKTGIDAQARRPPRNNWPYKLPVHFVDVGEKAYETSSGTSKFNVQEVKKVAEIVNNLLNSGDLCTQDIGIVTPYRAQAQKISLETRNKVNVRTVDGYQGQECEVVIFSAVRNNPGQCIGFLADKPKLNVLLTRAKRGLVVVGSRKTLSSNADWKAWLDWLDAKTTEHY